MRERRKLITKYGTFAQAADAGHHALAGIAVSSRLWTVNLLSDTVADCSARLAVRALGLVLEMLSNRQ